MRLTKNQEETLELVLQGFSNQEIADRLFVCEKSIRTRLTKIYRAFGLSQQHGKHMRSKLMAKLIEMRAEARAQVLLEQKTKDFDAKVAAATKKAIERALSALELPVGRR